MIINNLRYYLPKKEKYWYVLTVSLVLSFVWVIVLKLLLGIIFKNDTAYLNILSQSTTLRFGFGFLMIGCISTVSLLWFTQQDFIQTENQKRAVEQLAKDAELFKLRQQLHPHFLFNSLNSISALIVSQPEKARHMVQQLSDFLRGTLKKEEHVLNSLNEELQHLQLYLDIEKVRFGHRLNTVIQVEESARLLQVPALLLQPAVENAIKFGLYDVIGAVTITIHATIQGNSLQIEITNPFDEHTSQTAGGTGFGLASIKRRLFLIFGRADLLTPTAHNHIFTATILIPQKNESTYY